VRIYGIYFDFASAEIKPQSKPTLDEICGGDGGASGLEVECCGHTDNIGEMRSTCSFRSKERKL